MHRRGSRRYCPSAWSSLKLGGRPSAFRCSGTTMEQCVIHFRYPMMYPVSHIVESIQQMGSSEYNSNDVSELRQIAIMQEALRSSSKVNYFRLMLNHNDQCSSLDYMVQTPSYVALQGWYNIDSTNYSIYCLLWINGEALAQPISYVSKHS